MLRHARRLIHSSNAFSLIAYAGRKMALTAWPTGAWRLPIVKRSNTARFVVLPKRWIVERTFRMGQPQSSSGTRLRTLCDNGCCLRSLCHDPHYALGSCRKCLVMNLNFPDGLLEESRLQGRSTTQPTPATRRRARSPPTSGSDSIMSRSFRLHQLADDLCKLYGGTRDPDSTLWVTDRIDANNCRSVADLGENRCARISKIREAVVFEKSVV